MKQAWALLVAIFAPLGGLGRVWARVTEYVNRLDAALDNPDWFEELRETPDGLRTVEAAIAFAEHWINIIVAARTAELVGGRKRLDPRWAGWAPAKPRPYASLMQRYQRMRSALMSIERSARRRAARILRQVAADPLGLAAPAPCVPDICTHACAPSPLPSVRVDMRECGLPIRAPP